MNNLNRVCLIEQSVTCCTYTTMLDDSLPWQPIVTSTPLQTKGLLQKQDLYKAAHLNLQKRSVSAELRNRRKESFIMRDLQIIKKPLLNKPDPVICCASDRDSDDHLETPKKEKKKLIIKVTANSSNIMEGKNENQPSKDTKEEGKQFLSRGEKMKRIDQLKSKIPIFVPDKPKNVGRDTSQSRKLVTSNVDKENNKAIKDAKSDTNSTYVVQNQERITNFTQQAQKNKNGALQIKEKKKVNVIEKDLHQQKQNDDSNESKCSATSKRKIIEKRNTSTVKRRCKLVCDEDLGVEEIKNDVQNFKSVQENDVTSTFAKLSPEIPNAVQNNSLEKTRELSHQLFSESKEREFIDSLDLTSVELIEPVIPYKHTPPNVNLNRKTRRRTPAKKKEVSFMIDGLCDTTSNKGRPARNRFAPKEFWMPRSLDLSNSNSSHECLDYKEEEKILRNEKDSCFKLPEINAADKSQLNALKIHIEDKSSKVVKTTGRKMAKESERLVIGNPIVSNVEDIKEKPSKVVKATRAKRKIVKESEVAIPNIDNAPAETKTKASLKVTKSKNTNESAPSTSTNAPSLCAEGETIAKKRSCKKLIFSNDENEDEQLSKSKIQEKRTENKVHFESKASKKYFTKIEDLNYTDHPQGFSTALTSILQKFKCGILKVKDLAFGRTASRNGHFGGVVVEGKVCMKIEENKQILTKGEVFHITPKKHWNATNLHSEDSLIYYWCGEFEQ